MVRAVTTIFVTLLLMASSAPLAGGAEQTDLVGPLLIGPPADQDSAPIDGLCAYTPAVGCVLEYDEPTLVYVFSIMVPLNIPVETCRDRDGGVTCGQSICRNAVILGDVVWMQIGGAVISGNLDLDCDHSGIAGYDDT